MYNFVEEATGMKKYRVIRIWESSYEQLKKMACEERRKIVQIVSDLITERRQKNDKG